MKFDLELKVKDQQIIITIAVLTEEEEQIDPVEWAKEGNQGGLRIPP